MIFFQYKVPRYLVPETEAILEEPVLELKKRGSDPSLEGSIQNSRLGRVITFFYINLTSFSVKFNYKLVCLKAETQLQISVQDKTQSEEQSRRSVVGSRGGPTKLSIQQEVEI